MRAAVGRRTAGVLAILLGGVLAGPASVPAQEAGAVFVSVSKSVLLSPAAEPFTKVVIANPGIAELQVLNPTQLLISGKAAGNTSLLIFYGDSKPPRNFDLYVHAGPVLPAPHQPATSEPHTVLIHRGDRVSERSFLRDKSELWIDLGSVRDEAPRR